jgi:hypothetical protein
VARIGMTGWELTDLYAESLTQQFASTTPPAAAAHTGSRGYRMIAADAGEFVTYAITGVLGRAYYQRIYFRAAANPSILVHIARTASTSVQSASIVYNTNGTYSVQNSAGATLFTGGALTANQWYMFELGVTVAASPTTTNGTITARVDGTQVYSASNVNTGTVLVSRYQFGEFSGSLGVGTTLDWDDWSINDDQGADQNSWPGVGAIRYARPVADVAGGTAPTNWLMNGATTGRNTGLDDNPPVYTAHSTTATTLVYNATNAASDLTIGMTDYTTLGVPATDVITVVQPIALTASSSTTATAGTFTLLSNPADTGLSLTQFHGTAAASTTNTTWRQVRGNVTYNPTVVRGTQPQIRLSRAAAATTVDTNGWALLVESQPGTDIPNLTARKYRPAGRRF